jgi:hypothetical protein
MHPVHQLWRRYQAQISPGAHEDLDGRDRLGLRRFWSGLWLRLGLWLRTVAHPTREHSMTHGLLLVSTGPTWLCLSCDSQLNGATFANVQAEQGPETASTSVVAVSRSAAIIFLCEGDGNCSGEWATLLQSHHDSLWKDIALLRTQISPGSMNVKCLGHLWQVSPRADRCRRPSSHQHSTVWDCYQNRLCPS